MKRVVLLVLPLLTATACGYAHFRPEWKALSDNDQKYLETALSGDVKPQYIGGAPLFNAIRIGDVAAVEQLAAMGVDPNGRVEDYHNDVIIPTMATTMRRSSASSARCSKTSNRWT